MAFENVYLTPEEQEQFAKRAIPRPLGRRGRNLGDGGGSPYQRCTIDRERGIYLFFCGMGDYDFETPPDDYYFAFVWDDVTGDSAVGIRLKRDFSSTESTMGKGYDVLWYSLFIDIPSNLVSKKELLVERLGEALKIYGIDGDPKLKEKPIVEFQSNGG